MVELDKIVDDYLSDSFHKDNDKPYTREIIQEWWQENREKYDSEIVDIIREEVEHRLMMIIYEEESKKDPSKN